MSNLIIPGQEKFIQKPIPAMQGPIIGEGSITLNLEPQLEECGAGFCCVFRWPVEFGMFIGPAMMLNDEIALAGLAALMRETFENGVKRTIKELHDELVKVGLRNLMADQLVLDQEKKEHEGNG